MTEMNHVAIGSEWQSGRNFFSCFSLTLEGALVTGKLNNSLDSFDYRKSKIDVWFGKSFNTNRQRAFFHPDYKLWLGPSYHKSAVLDDEPVFYLALGFSGTAS